MWKKSEYGLTSYMPWRSRSRLLPLVQRGKRATTAATVGRGDRNNRTPSLPPNPGSLQHSASDSSLSSLGTVENDFIITPETRAELRKQMIEGKTAPRRGRVDKAANMKPPLSPEERKVYEPRLDCVIRWNTQSRQSPVEALVDPSQAY